MIDRLHKIKTKQALAQAEKKRKTIHKSPAVISGKRQEFNHYKGQPFNEFDVKKLSSHGWKHYKSKGDYFTIQSHGKVGPSVCYSLNKFLSDEHIIKIRRIIDVNMNPSPSVA